MLVDTSSPCPLPFFFNDTATTEIYTLSLHDALPISDPSRQTRTGAGSPPAWPPAPPRPRDRKSTRLNSSHTVISYAVFCLKKKNKNHRGATSEKTQRGKFCTHLATKVSSRLRADISG